MEKTESSSSNQNTAYFDGRREWNERFGGSIKAAHTWKIVALISLIIAAVSVSGLAYMAGQNKLIPYIVEVDKLGGSVATHQVQQIAYNNPKVIKYNLAEFISNFKTIYSDPKVQKETILKSYRYLTPSYSSFNIVNNYFKDNSPFSRLEKEIVNVKMDSIVPINENTYQLDWHEEVFDKKGNKLRTDYFRASATILIVPPKTEEEIFRNPIGMYITDFNFSQIINK
ncbi:MAG: conjugal transfer protein TrbF [Campylobacterales bacterium]|nr:conjugal transfer protein TrbF [Campylobacterales bacterium]